MKRLLALAVCLSLVLPPSSVVSAAVVRTSAAHQQLQGIYGRFLKGGSSLSRPFAEHLSAVGYRPSLFYGLAESELADAEQVTLLTAARAAAEATLSAAEAEFSKQAAAARTAQDLAALSALADEAALVYPRSAVILAVKEALAKSRMEAAAARVDMIAKALAPGAPAEQDGRQLIVPGSFLQAALSFDAPGAGRVSEVQFAKDKNTETRIRSFEAVGATKIPEGEALVTVSVRRATALEETLEYVFTTLPSAEVSQPKYGFQYHSPKIVSAENLRANSALILQAFTELRAAAMSGEPGSGRQAAVDRVLSDLGRLLEAPAPAVRLKAAPKDLGVRSKSVGRRFTRIAKDLNGSLFVVPAKITKEGVAKPLAFDPQVPAEGLLRGLWRNIVNLPEKVRRIRRFMQRVNEEVDGITDEKLWWSVNRLAAMQKQEGILRMKNKDLINPWPEANLYQKASYADFRESSLDDESIMKYFGFAMDLEEPTAQYQYSFAHNLHWTIPWMSHFLGATFQEMVIAAALRGKTPEMSIWHQEEARHGSILEFVFNATRAPGRPVLWQQGSGPRLPKNKSTAHLAVSAMANRSLAELFASVGYLVIRANAVKGSPTDRALHGLFMDEALHYVLMSTMNKHGFGFKSRWLRLAQILYHSQDYPAPRPKDTRISRWKMLSPLAIWQGVYVTLKVDQRINRFIDENIPEALGKKMVGPVYKTPEEAMKAAMNGEHVLPMIFPMEQNPHLTKAKLRELGERFGEEVFSVDRRGVSERTLKQILDGYRRNSLSNPKYWVKSKGYQRLRSNVVMRPLEKSPGHSLYIVFGGPNGPEAVIAKDPEGLDQRLRRPLKDMTMLQIGKLMDAASVDVASQVGLKEEEMKPERLLQLLNYRPDYRDDPIPVLK